MRIGIAASAAALSLACALPARASNEFEDGFKDELGRLAAQQAVSGGQQLVSTLLSAYLQAARSRAAQPEPREYRPRGQRHGREHGHRRDRRHDPQMGHYDHSHEPFGYHCHP